MTRSCCLVARRAPLQSGDYQSVMNWSGYWPMQGRSLGNLITRARPWWIARSSFGAKTKAAAAVPTPKGRDALQCPEARPGAAMLQKSGRKTPMLHRKSPLWREQKLTAGATRWTARASLRSLVAKEARIRHCVTVISDDCTSAISEARSGLGTFGVVLDNAGSSLALASRSNAPQWAAASAPIWLRNWKPFLRS